MRNGGSAVGACADSRARDAGGRDREHQAHQGAAARLAVDLQLAAMPLHHAEHHGQPEAGAAFTLGGEERFQAAAANGFGHADAVVFDLDDDLAVARIVRGCAA